jgi:RNA polymerase sigma factor (sigma-70 family)
MTFPDTRHTFIHRLATSNTESDWQEFLTDYWGPVCRFARRRGGLQTEDAEDIASQTFEALIRNELLVRWVANRGAKLRTLLCKVIRNVLANKQRVEMGRARLLRENADVIDDRNGVCVVRDLEVSAEEIDAFYTAWVEQLLDLAVEAILAEYHRAGKGDCFRVLYGRLCEGMTAQEIATALNLRVTVVENYYKSARHRLTKELESQVRQHVTRYCLDEDIEGEFRAEWTQLGTYLQDHGGLEDVVRRAYDDLERSEGRERQESSRIIALNRCTELLRDPRPDDE